MPIPVYNSDQDQTKPTTSTAGQASLDTLSSTNNGGDRVLGTASGDTVTAPGYSTSNEAPLSKEEADRLYEERMEEEAKRDVNPKTRQSKHPSVESPTIHKQPTTEVSGPALTPSRVVDPSQQQRQPWQQQQQQQQR
ncbi:hypothetical protein ETB97_011535 [Aspergillus alliaceus]|uniref:Uncharacterized protein n=1 Tax=Petromyces alliaceus TaxID=209559 RepID=A0A8H6A4D2_PETAA|nr:hypothetical protein ETB97_011535 [Aspergillus burnettii]